MSVPATNQLIQKLIEDCKLPTMTMNPPVAVFSNRLSIPATNSNGSPRRSSLTPPLSPPAYERLSATHSYSLPADGLIPSRTVPSFVQPAKQNLNLPQFYFPKGKPLDPAVSDKNQKIISTCFAKDNLKLSDFESITTQLCGLPKFLNQKLFQLAGGVDSISKSQFARY